MRFGSALPPLRLLASAALAMAALGACSSQGEGELCNPNAGHTGADDCQNGLVCVTSAAYSLGRCCPQDRGAATTAVCSLNSGGLDANPAPPDASTAQTGDDAPSESAANSDTAPSESAANSDAGGDASDGTTD
jgi:hypothetical protein